jgi:hypothetical protein
MRTPERLSRKDRRRWRLAPALGLVFGLLVVTAAFLAVQVYWEPEIKPRTPATASVPSPRVLRARCDSLIVAVYESFVLTEPIRPGQPEAARGGVETYPAFQQPWPAELPFLAFVEKLNTLARADSLTCDCLESSGEGWLDCVLLSQGITGARISLKADPATNFAGREVALAFEHLTTRSVEEISSLLKSGMQLSYIAGPEAPLNARLRDLISRKGITAILRLPASEKGWRNLIAVAGLGRKAGRKSSSGKPDRALIDEALERHPAVKLLIFDFSEGADWELVEKIMQRAKAKKIALLITPDQPAEIVNAAGRTGIQTFQGELAESLAGKPLTATKNNILKSILSGGPPKGSIACPDTTDLTLENLWLFKTYFDKLGVKIRPLMKAVVPFEGPPSPAL